jgi:threonine dehydratase
MISVLSDMSELAASFEDIVDAAARIKGKVHRTPVLGCQRFNKRTGVETVFKCENFQKGGAFKIRGATNFVNSLSETQRSQGVVTYSSGNHAQAVAIATEAVGVKATIVMPDDAPRSKMEATLAHGANVAVYDRLKKSREAIAKQIAAETGAVVVPPYDHPLTIAGQGTTALELLEDEPELDALVVCVGGGGLISGCSIAARTMQPGIRVFGIEPELANDTYLSFEAGRQIDVPNSPTIADGLRTPCPGDLTFPVVQRYVERIILVSEDEIKETVKYLLSRMKILAEPSGAVAAAAVLFGKLPPEIGRAGVIISGGNVDFEVLAEF